MSPELSVSEFVAVLNQTLEYAYNSVVIYGELANFRVNKNRWVYFDLKDEESKLSFFGTVYKLPGPLEDGMMLKVRGTPRLHPQYGFSILITQISPMGTGSIKRLSDLLAAKLEKEGLFSPERKRSLPYPPSRIGLITSVHSAAFSDFTKILNDRWGGIDIDCYDVTVQGDQAPDELIAALKYFSALAEPPDVVVMVRGGGSPEDLAAFSNEQVTRAVAASRVPTLVAIGHERDVSLAELAADTRASTPSNAAERLVPDKKQLLTQLSKLPELMRSLVEGRIRLARDNIAAQKTMMSESIESNLLSRERSLNDYNRLLNALSPLNVLKRGYAIVRHEGRVSDGSQLSQGDIVAVEMVKIYFEAGITKINGGE